MQTGDILLFDIRNNIFSSAIKLFTDSIYDHVAMIIIDPNFNGIQLKGTYIIESTLNEFNDAEDNRKKFGVQIVSLDEKLKYTTGTVYHRKLNCNRNDIFYENLKVIHSKVHNLPYDINPIDWIEAATKSNLRTNTHRKNEFWCSALVAYLYVGLKLLPIETNWTLVTPKNWGTEVDQNVLVFNNCTLDKEQKFFPP